METYILYVVYTCRCSMTEACVSHTVCVCVCRRVIDKRIDSMEQSFLIEMYVICCERT